MASCEGARLAGGFPEHDTGDSGTLVSFYGLVHNDAQPVSWDSLTWVVVRPFLVTMLGRLSSTRTQQNITRPT